jgi:hypothetical protein
LSEKSLLNRYVLPSNGDLLARLDATAVIANDHRSALRRVQGFVQRLALRLTSWQAATFRIGEYV